MMNDYSVGLTTSINNSNRKTNKAVYVVTAKDFSEKVYYIKTFIDLLSFSDSSLDVRGVIVSKTEYNKLKKSRGADQELIGEPIHIILQNERWLSVENVSYSGPSSRVSKQKK